MEIQLRKFDMSEIKDDKVVVLIGKRDTGKSFLCKDILYHHCTIPVCQVISGTEAANEFYSKMVPKLLAIAKNRTDTRIYVSGDKNINYGRVLEVMGTLSGAGFSKVALISAPYKN